LGSQRCVEGFGVANNGVVAGGVGADDGFVAGAGQLEGCSGTEGRGFIVAEDEEAFTKISLFFSLGLVQYISPPVGRITGVHQILELVLIVVAVP
jgi:hypothetical protein